MFKKILVPTDGSPLSDMAVEKAVALAKAVGAGVVFLTCVEPFRLWTDNTDQLAYTRDEYERFAHASAAHFLDKAAAVAASAGVACKKLVSDGNEPHRAIIDAAAAQGCDLIAMASHGRRGMAALVLGSETQKVLTHSTMPVLVYR